MNLFMEYIDWILGISALLIQLCIIKKWWWAPIAGFLGQSLWLTYALSREDYGLIPSIGGFTILYAYGIWKWTKEKHTQQFISRYGGNG
jgi:predicted Rdx family selenoprotein